MQNTYWKKNCLNVEIRGTNMVSALFILQGAKNAGQEVAESY